MSAAYGCPTLRANVGYNGGMAAFTRVDAGAFGGWAKARFGFAEVAELSAIVEGIENSNYRFVGDGTPYVFTIFERLEAEAVAYYLAFTAHLAAADLPVPAALGSHLPTADGLLQWEGKHCAVVEFFRGASIAEVSADDCYRMGQMAARIHLAARDFAHPFTNPRGFAWRQMCAPKLRPHLSTAQQELLDTASAHDARFAKVPLPHASCHCDLFRNNVLWDGGKISAVIDFYFGGRDALVFDLAVCACDWCFDGGAFDAARVHALLDGYTATRRFCDLEKQCFGDFLIIAAARFWLSRLDDIYYPRTAEVLEPHDPVYFETILRAAVAMRGAIEKIIKQVA